MIICWCQRLTFLKRFDARRRTCFSNPARLFCIFPAQVLPNDFESLIPSKNRLTIEEDGCKPSPFRRCFFGAKLAVVELREYGNTTASNARAAANSWIHRCETVKAFERLDALCLELFCVADRVFLCYDAEKAARSCNRGKLLLRPLQYRVEIFPVAYQICQDKMLQHGKLPRYAFREVPRHASCIGRWEHMTYNGIWDGWSQLSLVSFAQELHQLLAAYEVCNPQGILGIWRDHHRRKLDELRLGVPYRRQMSLGFVCPICVLQICISPYMWWDLHLRLILNRLWNHSGQSRK